MQSVSGRFLDIGNYRYSTGSEEDTVIRYWGFVALRLDRRLPHMVLDARSNNVRGGSSLAVAFDRTQVLSLEGDFDRHFTLYCPRDYERDALYIFTPDLMALLIDNVGAFDVEIVEDWMFVYSPVSLDTIDEATMRRCDDAPAIPDRGHGWREDPQPERTISRRAGGAIPRGQCNT